MVITKGINRRLSNIHRSSIGMANCIDGFIATWYTRSMMIDDYATNLFKENTASELEFM